MTWSIIFSPSKPAMSPEEISLAVMILLFLVALIAAYVDVLVGGGGLLTIPALLLAGVPAISALGTNKFQAVAGSGTATIKLIIGRHISFSKLRWWMLASFIGSVIAALLVQEIDPSAFNWLIPLVIVCIAIYFLLANKTITEGKEKLSKRVYGLTVVPLIGFYDGMFGPATGSFFVMAGTGLRGSPIIKATMIAKSLNFASNFGSLLIFIWFGKIYWSVGVLMIAGQIIGAYLGTKMLLSIDPSILRRLVVVMSFFILAAWLSKELL